MFAPSSFDGGLDLAGPTAGAVVLKGRSVDFLFIDGDHSYGGVVADFNSYAPLSARHGLIALHDIAPDHGSAHSGDVPLFWWDLSNRYKSWGIIEATGQDCYGIGVIQMQSQPD